MDNQASPGSLAEQAKQFYLAGDFTSAAKVFGEASDSYKAGDDMLMYAEMLNNRSVALLRAKQAQSALEAAQGTDKVFAEAGDLRRQGMSLANQASAQDALKHSNEAIDLYRSAGEILEKAGEDVLRVEVMQLLSVLYLRRLKFYDAIIALQSGLAAVKNPTPKQRFMKKLLFFRL
jgi:tetratricopeptide (TPR) repeat protein